MEEGIEELKEKLGRYMRLSENDDFIKTLEDMEESYQLKASVFSACNCPNPDQYMWAKGGVQTLINRLRGLVDETEALVEQAIEQENNK